MGSRPNKINLASNLEDLAYIAGFLDGDGSLMLQVKKRADIKKGWRLMATICFYQDSRHDKPLDWIRKQLEIGYISKRNDGITELRINGYDQVMNVLRKLLPYIKFKKRQAKLVIECLEFLRKKGKDLDTQDHYKIIDWILSIQDINYQSPHKKTRQDYIKLFGLTP